MKKRIPPEEARATFGIAAAHEVMPNGERRFRLIDRSGRGYIRTEAPPHGAWQNSHFHKGLKETYIVESGWIAFAVLSDKGTVNIEIIRPGQVRTTPPGLVHNVYMPAEAVTHVVKHGDAVPNDWETSEQTALLDRLTKPLSESDFFDADDAGNNL